MAIDESALRLADHSGKPINLGDVGSGVMVVQLLRYYG